MKNVKLRELILEWLKAHPTLSQKYTLDWDDNTFANDWAAIYGKGMMMSAVTIHEECIHLRFQNKLNIECLYPTDPQLFEKLEQYLIQLTQHAERTN